MISDSSPSPYVASASTEYPGFGAYRAFDGGAGENQYWVATTNTGWLELDLGATSSQTLVSYGIQVDSIPEPNRAPMSWSMQGSNDNSTWVTLDTESGQTGWTSGQVRTFNVAGSGSYRYFRINVTANNGDIYLEIAEVYLNTGAMPGSHDLSVNPNFVDPTRNTATFDSAYLGNTAAAWSSTATYTVGQTVSSADPTIYSGAGLGFPSTGAVINYRYTNGTYQSTACNGANPKPGLLANNSRACWEWATLYDLRQAIGSWNPSLTPTCPGNGVRLAGNQCLYDDQTIGAHGVDLITVLIQWLRAGYSPTNSALSLAGADGQDIGAVPVTIAAATYPPLNRGTGTVIRRAVVRKGVIR